MVEAYCGERRGFFKSTTSAEPRQWVLSVFIGALVLLSAGSATAQEDRFSIQQYNPAPARSIDYFAVTSARVLPHLYWDFGLHLDYADDPLVLVADGERIQSIVGGQLTMNLLGAVGFIDILQLGFAVPLILTQSGEELDLIPSADASNASFSAGDLRLIPKVMLYSSERIGIPGGISLGFQTDFFIPVGNADNFQGEGFRAEPRLLLDAGSRGGLRFGVNLGYMVRPEAQLANVEVNDTLTFGFAMVIPVIKMLSIVPELSGGVSLLADEISAEEIPLEVLVGLKLIPVDGLLFELGGGFGLVEGFGTPDYRLIFGLGYHYVPSDDRDRDGYPNDEDDCPDEPEDFDYYEDQDGCPEFDNDLDGILDLDDDCPLDPEDIDRFEDEDGCPDPDNDRDTILDLEDQCPMEPEDFDLWEDEDGCPDPDNDEDGFFDEEDECPNQPETWNNHQDEDGCPDEELIEVTCERIDLGDRVYFETDSDIIEERSYELLNQASRTVLRREDLRLMHVEGHTDSDGSARYNRRLSQRRAESVVAYLVRQGVDEERLIAIGYGEERPIADNESAAGRQENRRVQFIIVEQEGCVDLPIP